MANELNSFVEEKYETDWDEKQVFIRPTITVVMSEGSEQLFFLHGCKLIKLIT